MRFLKLIFIKLFRINDTPQKIAAGFGLGVCLGIFPGSGPIAALTLSFLLRLNRAAALFGSLLTNTWLSFVTFVLAVKAGSFILGVNWRDTYNNLTAVLKNFHFKDLFDYSVFEIILPLLIGYLAVTLLLGLAAYISVLSVFVIKKRFLRSGVNSS